MCDNRLLNRVEPLITVKQLRERYVFGIDTTDGQGRELPDDAWQSYLDTAISMLEHDLDISIIPREHVGDCAEKKDYNANDYWQWSYFQLNNLPVIEVKNIKAVYPNSNILSYPKEWYKLQKHDGILRIIPNSGSIANFQVDAGGQYFPEIFRYNGMVPLVWEIEYVSGFENGKVPALINTAIGLIAAMIALNNLADLILGTGIQSQSIGLDGLSQSVSLTASAENSTNSAKLKAYNVMLFGGTVNSRDQGIIHTLRTYYQGQTMNLI